MKSASVLRSRVLPAAAATVVIAVLAAAAWYGYDAISSRPLERVVFAGDLDKLARGDLDALARSVRGMTSLGAVREAARRMPWVRDASVRRRFPDAVEITFETHEALARWGDGGLVSSRGDVFKARHAASLPRFRGPEGAAPLMAREYPVIAREAAPLASPIAELRLSARGGWQVLLASGLELELGRGDIHPRLQRFAAAWPHLAASGVETRHADLRHANGFALKTANDKR
jgi:cell division protein FtsQ